MTHESYLDPQHPAFPDDFLTDAYRVRPTAGRPGRRRRRRSSSTSPSTTSPDDENQRWTTWYDVEPLSRGPEPRPDWVVTSRGAIDTELGILKTGKEADVFLLERADPLRARAGVVMAAKRYRSTEHRTFHRSAAYTEGRSMKRSRDQRAIKRKSTFGKLVAAGEWAVSEWEALKRWLALGLPVPYPVQIDGQEILMEWITVETRRRGRDTAPRLAQTRPETAAAGVLLRPAARRAGHHGAGGHGARRPLGVQHPGRR